MSSVGGKRASDIGDAVAAAVAASANVDRDGKLSVKQMKHSLRASLADSGVLRTIKSQLRREFIANMKDKANGAPSSYELQATSMNLQSRICFSSVFHMLKQRGMNHSLAVFAAESGLETKNAILSEMDIVRAMNLQEDSKVLLAIANDFKQVSKYEGVSSGSKENRNNSNSDKEEEERSNVLDLMIQHSFRNKVTNTSEMCVQTDSAAMDPRQTLDSTLAQVRNRFQARLEADANTPKKSIEERMLQYVIVRELICFMFRGLLLYTVVQ